MTTVTPMDEFNYKSCFKRKKKNEQILLHKWSKKEDHENNLPRVEECIEVILAAIRLAHFVYDFRKKIVMNSFFNAQFNYALLFGCFTVVKIIMKSTINMSCL